MEGISRPSILVILLGLAWNAAAAADLPPLTLVREGNWLEIRGEHLPGGRIRVNYLEAYCRAGSTDADWRDTVIPHESQVTGRSPDGRTIEIRARCVHADFRLGGLEPGATRTIRGAIYVVPADIPALLARYNRDFPEQTRPAVECTPRAGLPNFFAKAKAGGEVQVAYLGGSITAAPGWRVGSLEWLKRRFPAATFSEINAAIGGTGSDLGAFRVGQDVIAGKPDLVFVEFAVNDGGAPPEQIQATMEGIVRQVKRADPATDICFVYTLSLPMLGDLEAGRCQRSAAAMETVAEHYRLPSVHFGPEVAERIAAGMLVFKGEKPEPFDAAAVPMLFSTDGVHPLVETGHVLYTDVLARSLTRIEQVGPAAEPRALPDPLRSDNWEAARLVPITREMLRGEWQPCEPDTDPLGRQFAKRIPALWRTATPGASLMFRVTVPEADGVKGRRIAAYDLLGPGGGTVAIRVDGGEPRKVPRIDGYCSYWRLATLALGDLSPGEHEIEVTLTAERPDKREILFEHNRPDLDKNPAKYATDSWYVGGLLVFGDVTPAGP